MIDTCVTCTEPLILDIDSDDDRDDLRPGFNDRNGRTVPDSVELNCGCHFHWSVLFSLSFSLAAANIHALHRECLLDAYSMNECPNCGKNVTQTSSTGNQQILCNLDNEGGLQEGIDIMPLLVEASYLKVYPEDRKGRAFVEFAAEGDAMSMLHMLVEHDSDDEVDGKQQATTDIEILRYQDPLGGMNSALHTAVLNNNEVVAWLLLWLASGLDEGVFPADVVQHAQELKIARGSLTGQADIRSLVNSAGRTAAQLAKEKGDLWARWVDAGWLES